MQQPADAGQQSRCRRTVSRHRSCPHTRDVGRNHIAGQRGCRARTYGRSMSAGGVSTRALETNYSGGGCSGSTNDITEREQEPNTTTMVLKVTVQHSARTMPCGLAPFWWRGWLGSQWGGGGAQFDGSGAEKAQGGMATVLVVPASDERKHGLLGLAMCWPGMAVNQLGLERGKEALGDSVDAPIAVKPARRSVEEAVERPRARGSVLGSG